MHINEVKKENLSKRGGNYIERKQQQQQLKPSQNPWVQVCLFILVSVLDMSWRGQAGQVFSSSDRDLWVNTQPGGVSALCCTALLVRNTASVPHLLLHTSGNQYLVTLEPPNSYLCHHAWGFQPLPLRAKWCVISSAVWSFGQLLSCRMNVCRRKNSWENTPNQTVVFKWSTSGIHIMLFSCCIQC